MKEKKKKPNYIIQYSVKAAEMESFFLMRSSYSKGLKPSRNKKKKE